MQVGYHVIVLGNHNVCLILKCLPCVDKKRLLQSRVCYHYGTYSINSSQLIQALNKTTVVEPQSDFCAITIRKGC